MFNELEGQKNISITIGDMQLSGKDCIVTNVNYDIPRETYECVERLGNGLISIRKNDSMSTITIEFKLLRENMFFELFKGNKKISNKKVKDCSINELLFAVRSKLKEE